MITLMKIRLGLLNEDIADRFKVSCALISQIFSTWVRATAKVLSSMIKVWVNTLKLKKFKSEKLHSIADGFNISNESAAKIIYVVVSPGKRGSSQMLPSEVTKTKNIAKTRILVEQVIRRLKVFRFIANEVPINMFSYIDGILQICAAILNMQSSIYGQKFGLE